MKEMFSGLGLMYVISALTMIVVIIAMAVDLVSGWRKAKVRGEAHTSYGFSRTLTKFLIYEGILLISCCIDTLVHFALYDYVSLNYRVPLVTLLMGVVLCAVELWSVYEKAESKQRRRMAQVAATAAQIVDRDKIADIIADAIRTAAITPEAVGRQQLPTTQQP